ncbi:hypothetical protein GCM10009551_040140 [Nocardiopsis tropica]
MARPSDEATDTAAAIACEIFDACIPAGPLSLERRRTSSRGATSAPYQVPGRGAGRCGGPGGPPRGPPGRRPRRRTARTATAAAPAAPKHGTGGFEAVGLLASGAVPRHVVGPREQPVEVLVGGSGDDAGTPEGDLAARAVDGDEAALAQRASADLYPVGSHGQAGDPHDGGLAHGARDDRGVAGRTPAGGDDPRGGGQAAHVVRGGLRTHEDHRSVRGHAHRRLGGGGHPADGDPGTRAQPPGQHVGLPGRVQPGRAHVPQVVRRDPEQRLAASDHALVREFGGHAHGRGPDEPARPDLQQPQFAGLEGELDVARVPVVLLDPAQGVEQARPHGRLPVGEFAQGPGRRPAGDDVIALAAEQDLAEGGVPTGVGVAAERDPAAAAPVAVAEHHRLHDHGGAQVVRDVVQVAVGACARGLPGGEHGPHRQLQLRGRLVGDRSAQAPPDTLLELRDRTGGVGLPVVGVPLRGGSAGGGAGAVRVRERGGEGGQEPQPRAQREPGVARLGGQPGGGPVREAEVEDRVHHAGHRHAGPGAHGHRQRQPLPAEAAPRGGFEAAHGGRELPVQALGEAPVAQKGAACLRGDDERRGHPQAEAVQEHQAVRLGAQRPRRPPGPRREGAHPPHRGIPRVASRSSWSSAHTVW